MAKKDDYKDDSLAIVQIEGEPLTVTFTVDFLSFLFAQENGADLVALCAFYRKTEKIQVTRQIYATTGYVASGCDWGENKVRSRKKVLEGFGFIENVYERDHGGKILAHYIRLKFHQPSSSPDSGEKREEVQERGSKVNKKERKKERNVITLEEALKIIPKDVREYEDFQKAYALYFEQKSRTKYSITDMMAKAHALEIERHNITPEDATSIVSESVAKSWAGLFFKEFAEKRDAKAESGNGQRRSRRATGSTGDGTGTGYVVGPRRMPEDWIRDLSKTLDETVANLRNGDTTTEDEEVILFDTIDGLYNYWESLDRTPEIDGLFISGFKTMVVLYGECCESRLNSWSEFSPHMIGVNSKCFKAFPEWLWKKHFKVREPKKKAA